MAERGRGELRIDPEDRPRASAPASGASPRASDGGRKGRRGGWGGRLARWGVLLALWALILIGGVLTWFWLTLPATNDLTASERRPSVTLLGSDGGLIATYGDLFGEPLKLTDAAGLSAAGGHRRRGPPLLAPSRASTRSGSARAVYVDLLAGHVVQGGSTITQQVAKNLFLTSRAPSGARCRS